MPGAPSRAQPKGKATNEDVTDVKNLAEGMYSAVALFTGFNGWILSEPEATAIAEPASRILARHKELQGVVREIADPMALMVAVSVPTLVRYAMWREYVGLRKVAVQRGIDPDVIPKQAPGPEPAAATEAPFFNGPGNSEIDRISRL